MVGIGVLVSAVARWLALGGGLLMLAAALMVTASVTGRRLGSGPLPGDFELVQMACGVAVLWFLPYATLARAHIVVETLTERLPRRARLALDALGLIGFAMLGVLIAATMAQGVVELRRAGTTTMVLQLPQVWGMAAAWLGALWLAPASLLALARLRARRAS